jgi:3-isopropylmalate/(R)-2-methylmalate dehydratase large subunit
MGRTLAEKILAAHADDAKASAGEIVEASVDFLMVHEVLGSRIIPILEKMGVDKVWDPDKVMVVNDHWAPASDTQSAEIHARNRDFVTKHGIKHFADVNCGISHQVLPEWGLVKPGDFLVGCDSHSTSYGAFNAMSVGLAATDSAIILATGRNWFKVPESIWIELNGDLRSPLTSKDVILKILSELGTDGANYQSIEFHGSTVDRMSVGSRLTMCNMGVEAGAKSAIMPMNEEVKKWVEKRTPGGSSGALEPDTDAEYRDRLSMDVGGLDPFVATPHSPANGVPVTETTGVEIDQAFIGSCTNGRLEDLEIAAKIVKGKNVHPGVRFIITPASTETYLNAMHAGFIEILIKAGGIVTNSTCGACVGGHLGVLGPGEVCISSTNRNFRGRMGHPDASIYLASPATVAASALTGKITDPRGV